MRHWRGLSSLPESGGGICSHTCKRTQSKGPENLICKHFLCINLVTIKSLHVYFDIEIEIVRCSKLSGTKLMNYKCFVGDHYAEDVLHADAALGRAEHRVCAVQPDDCLTRGS